MSDLLIEEDPTKVTKLLQSLKSEKVISVGGLLTFFAREPTPENLKVLEVTLDQWKTLKEEINLKVGKKLNLAIIKE